MSTANKLTYLNTTKQKIKQSINNLGGSITSDTTFRNYATELDSIYNKLPKVSDTGTDLSLSPTLEARLGLIPRGNTFQQTYSGKNLLNALNYLYGTSNGIKTTYENGYYKLKGTVSASWCYIANNVPLSLSTGTYTLSITKILPFRVYVTFKFTDNTTGTVAINSGSTSASYTASKEVVSYELSCSQMTSGTTYNETVGIQLEVGSSATSFEPYTGGQPSPNPSYPQMPKVVTGNNNIHIENEDGTQEQNYPLSLGNIELVEIPDTDYADYIEGTPDNWVKKEVISKIALDGTSGTYSKTATNRFNVDGLINYRQVTGNADYLCNYYTGYQQTPYNSAFDTLVSNKDSGFNLSSASYTIRFKDNRFNEISDFKNWLQTQHNNSTPVIIYYILATPTDIPITDTTLISQLNALYYANSYNGVTNISTTHETGNMPMIFTASALKDNSGGGSSHDWSAIGYSGEPESIEEDYNYAKNIYDNWDATRTSYANLYYNDLNLVFFPLVDTSAGTSFKSMFSGCVSLQTVPLINTSSGVVFSTMFQSCRRLTEIPQLDTSNGINLSSMFASCTKLKKIPVLNFSKATNISGMFSGCSLLTDESLDNILQSCVNINPSYQNTKTLGVLGFTSTYYPTSRIQALPHYQDFINAGWTIGY